MSNPIPKPNDRLKTELRSLRTHGVIKGLTEHLQALLDHHKGRLVVSSLQDVPHIQGRAAQLQDLIDLLTKE